MGKHNSSRTRVEPVFEALYNSDPSGRLWLPSLLQLGSRPGNLLRGLDAGRLIDNHPRWWGKSERRLDPPKALLQWLVRNALSPASDALWGGEATRGKREKLVAQDEATIAEALRLLEGPLKYRVWYVLEGQSRPDACIETERIILVVEGKRTEPEATVATTWMPQRSQMLRHMDAAWEIRGKKQVLGLLIVEGDG